MSVTDRLQTALARLADNRSLRTIRPRPKGVISLAGNDYLGAGAERVILGVYHEELAALTPETLSKDPKTMLQELLQGERYARPEYFLVGSSGPAHDRTFDCGCRIPELGITTTGQAGSRRAAEQIAAKLAYDRALERIGSDRRES